MLLVRLTRLLAWSVAGGVVALGLVACSGSGPIHVRDHRPLLTVTWRPVLGDSGPYRVYYGVSSTPFDGFREAMAPPLTLSHLASGVSYLLSVQIVDIEGNPRWVSEIREIAPIRGVQQRLDLGELSPYNRRTTLQPPERQALRSREPSPSPKEPRVVPDPPTASDPPIDPDPDSSPPPVSKKRRWTGKVTLEWQPPTTSANGEELDDLYGYWVYYGTAENRLVNKVWSAKTRATVKPLRVGETYFFRVSAMDLMANESEPSKTVKATVK